MEQEQSLLDLFSGLASSDPKQIDDTICTIKKRLDGPKGLSLLLSLENKGILQRGLAHTFEQVRELTLSQLLRCTESNEGIEFLAETGLMEQVVQAITDQSIGVAERAIKLIAALNAKGGSAQLLVLSPQRVEALESILRNGDEIIRFRVLDLFVRLASASPSAWETCLPFLQQVVVLLNNDDVLVQLNALELIDQIISIPQGVDFLKSLNTFEELLRISDTQDPSGNLLSKRILQLFGSVAQKVDQKDSEVIFSPLFGLLLKFLNGEDNILIEEAITVIGHIGHTQWGTRLLMTQYSDLLAHWFSYLYSTNPSIRIVFLHAFANALRVEKDSEKLYRLEQEKQPEQIPLNILMKYVEQPFDELRYAVYNVLNSMLAHVWGLQEVVKRPGFFEWVASRTAEPTKQGKELKFALVEAIVKVDGAKDIVGSPLFAQLQRFLREGVFYLPPESAVVSPEDIAA